ncbi:MAG: Rab family GTPase [Candidatus Heimdallarchaeota archaeon]
MYNSKRRIYKVCIVGDAAVGKTTILYQYVDGKFVENTQLTIGINFFTKNIYLEELDVKTVLQIWDLGGQEHFNTVRPNFYRGATGLIYTYDLTRKITLNNLIKWKEEIGKVIDLKIPTILIGNKLDLIDPENQQTFIGAIQNLKNDLGFSDYFETSAKDNVGIDEAFHKITKDIYKFLLK